MTTMRDLGRSALAAGLALALVGAAPAGAQETDLRWQPWIGCWEPAIESAEVDLVCIRAADAPGAMEILRIKGTDVVGREAVWTDTKRHEAAHEGCTGWEEGSFSADGRRIFLRSAYTCSDVTHEGSGILAFTSPGEWLDVRAAGMGGQGAAWVQRFQPADPALAEAAGFGDLLGGRAWAARTARLAAGAGVDVDDVIEATAQVSVEAVKAFLAEQGRPLELSAAELVRMADAGVPDHVIDVAVAVTYPERFTLRGQGEEVAMSALDDGSLRRRWVAGSYYGPGFYDPFFSPWSLRYGYRMGYGYSGYGYDPYSYGWGYSPYSYGWGYGGGYWGGYAPVVIDVDHASRQHGRVIAGRGYSRGGSGGSASSGGYSGSGGSRSSSPPSSGSSGVSSSGGYSSRGASSGSSSSGSSGSTRTAKPRGGGGGL